MEAKAKGFVARLGKKQGCLLAAQLQKRTLDAARATPFAVYTSYTADQVGNSFGERLANSMETVFDKGYEKLIVIGTDCPALTTSVICRAAVQISEKTIALNPSDDGGTYLIGLHKSVYSRHQFLSLPWCSGSVFFHLANNFRNAGYTVHSDVFKSDIDALPDLLQWIDDHHADAFSREIACLLSAPGTSPHPLYRRTPVPASHALTQGLRGPPVPASA